MRPVGQVWLNPLGRGIKVFISGVSGAIIHGMNFGLSKFKYSLMHGYGTY